MKVASMSSKHDDALILTCTTVECSIADCCNPKGVPYVYCTLLVSDVMWNSMTADGVPSHDSEGRGEHLQALRHHHTGDHIIVWYRIQYNIMHYIMSAQTIL